MKGSFIDPTREQFDTLKGPNRDHPAGVFG
jgi:hypothetical protein